MSGRVSEGLLIALSLIAFVAAAAWLVSVSRSGEEAYPPMSTYSPRSDGSKGLYELCVAAGMDVHRHHDSEYDYPDSGCVVVLDNPDMSMTMLFGSELDERALRLWLADGGRLLLFSDPLRQTGTELFAELDEQEGLQPLDSDAFDWESPVPHDPWEAPPYGEVESAEAGAENGERVFSVDRRLLATRLAISGEEGNIGALWRMYEPGQRYELAADRPPRLADVEQIETASSGFLPYLRGDVVLAGTDQAGVGGLEPIALHRRVGAGEVLWVTRSEIAANSWLDRVDNHRLVLALIDYMAADEALYFDEHLHGYVRERANPLGMLTGTTGGRLLLALAVLATVMFLGAAIRPARFRPQPVPPRRQASEMVLAQASLYRRARAVRSVADALVEGVRRAYSRALCGGSPVTTDELLRWLRTERVGPIGPVRALIEYLAGTTDPDYRQLSQLAGACEAVRWELEH